MGRIWTMGETMVSLRADASVAMASRWTTHVAGAESNVAIGLARLGHEVTWASRLGDDAFGELIRRELRAEGVRVEAVADNRRRTGFMFLSPASFGWAADYHRALSAASAMGPEMADLVRASTPELVVLSGITPALGDRPAEATRAVLAAAKELGATVVFDVNFRGKLWTAEQAGDALAPLLAGVDVLVGSHEELAMLGTADESALIDRGPAEVLTKLGAQGARYTSATESFEVPTKPATVVDAVGAGDAFVAGYVAGLLDGLTPAERMARANLMGRAAVTHRGDFEGLPTIKQLRAQELAPQDDVAR